VGNRQGSVVTREGDLLDPQIRAISVQLLARCKRSGDSSQGGDEDMNTNHEFEISEEQSTTEEEKFDAIELSLSDLDLIGGGSIILPFG
jgi:hypothetical protein